MFCNCVQTGIFWHKRHLRLIESRHPLLILTFSILCIFELLIIIPFLQLCITNKCTLKYSTIIIYVSIFHETLLIFLVFILLSRLWLLYFNYKFQLASLNQIWRKTINPNDKNFYLNYKKIFGNSKYILLIIIMFTLCIFILFESLFFFTNTVNSSRIDIITHGLILLCCIIAIIMMKTKVNKIFDKFFIKTEMKRLLMFLIIYSILNVIDQILKLFFIKFDQELDSIQYLLQIIFFTIMVIVQVIC